MVFATRCICIYVVDSQQVINVCRNRNGWSMLKITCQYFECDDDLNGGSVEMREGCVDNLP